MSEANVDVVRELFRAWEERRPNDALAHLHPEIEVDMTGGGWGGLGAGVDHGHEGVARTIGSWFDALQNIEWHGDAFIDAGDDVIVWIRLRAEGRASGAPFEARVVSAYTVRKVLVVRWRTFDSLETAAKTLGV
jgi:ketosteroid isomerase-like protein